MVRVSDLDEYLHGDGVADGDVLEIVGKPIYIGVEDSMFGRAHLEIAVKLPSGKQKIWTPNKTTLKNLAKVYGDETSEWTGRKVHVELAKQNVRGEMKLVIYGHPVTPTPNPPIQREQSNLRRNIQ